MKSKTFVIKRREGMLSLSHSSFKMETKKVDFKREEPPSLSFAIYISHYSVASLQPPAELLISLCQVLDVKRILRFNCVKTKL